MQARTDVSPDPERGDEMVMQEPQRARALAAERDPNRVAVWLLAAVGGPLALDRFYVGRPHPLQLVAPMVWAVSMLAGRRWGHPRFWLAAAAAVSVAIWVANAFTLRARLRVAERAAARNAQASLDQDRIDIETRGAPAAG